jgi:rhodanese-related sulfurtransferase
MSLTLISPQKAKELVAQGAVLVDVRAADEHVREHIAQARSIPMENLRAEKLTTEGTHAVIFHCRSGNRTKVNAAALSASVEGDAYILDGGLDAWIKAGLPVVKNAAQPLELQRQVQMTVGTLVVLGTLLGATVSPWFLVLSGFVGTGLIVAGVTGFCGLARVLMRMPWNRSALLK